MKSILALLNPAEWASTALMVVVIAGGCYLLEQRIEQRGYDRAVIDYEKQAKKIDDKRESITPVVEAKHAEVVTKIVTVTKTLVKEVPVYVKDTDCPMSGGFRVYHDAAANGEVPDASSIPDAAPAPAQDVATTVAENYGACNIIRQNLIHLQSWVAAQKALTQ